MFHDAYEGVYAGNFYLILKKSRTVTTMFFKNRGRTPDYLAQKPKIALF